MITRPSVDKVRSARALWYANKGVVELRSAPLPPPKPGEARVRALFSGISRGTERLVFNGNVGQGEWERMRCPLQEGAFPFPVKYGYCATGVVEEGPSDLVGREVFCLHPHQDHFNAPVEALTPIPKGVPSRRATLAANMQTALNALWDSGAGPGDRILVVGAGVVGLLVAALAAQLPGAEVTAVDPDQGRRPLVEALGAAYARPQDAPGDADVVFHTSATAAGLDTAIKCAGFEAHGSRDELVRRQACFGAPGRRLPQPPAAARLLPGGPASRRAGARAGTIAAATRPRCACWQNLSSTSSWPRRSPSRTPRASCPRILAPDAAGLAPVIRYAQA